MLREQPIDTVHSHYMPTEVASVVYTDESGYVADLLRIFASVVILTYYYEILSLFFISCHHNLDLLDKKLINYW